MQRLLGKTVLITGASSGIGEACAHEFAKQGSNLVLLARRIDRLNELKRNLTSRHKDIKIHISKCDVSSRDQCNSAVCGIPPDFAPISVCVNNAGLAKGIDPVESVSDEAINAMFDVNVKGLLYVTQAVVPIMKTQAAGHIINISSIAGTQCYKNGGIYCASKHAVDAITQTLRMELVDTPINVTSIDPGLVETEFSVVRLGDKLKADAVYSGLEALTATDVAETVVFAASRRPNVQIASMVVFPTCQASVNVISRK